MTRQNSIGIAILAAGESTRLGTPKQLLKYKGKTLIKYITEVALGDGTSDVSIILGSDASALRRELDGLPVTIIENPKWKEGLSSSIVTATESLHHSHDAILFMTVDQPMVTSDLLKKFITVFQTSDSLIVACKYADTVGVPALFEKTLYPRLLALQGDHGAKDIILDEGAEAMFIPFPDGEIDIDTLADLEKLDQ